MVPFGTGEKNYDQWTWITIETDFNRKLENLLIRRPSWFQLSWAGRGTDFILHPRAIYGRRWKALPIISSQREAAAVEKGIENWQYFVLFCSWPRFFSLPVPHWGGMVVVCWSIYWGCVVSAFQWHLIFNWKLFSLTVFWRLFVLIYWTTLRISYWPLMYSASKLNWIKLWQLLPGGQDKTRDCEFVSM